MPFVRQRRGFGLLEAIVALALLSASGLAIFDWISQNLRTATRLQQVDRLARLQLSAQALIDTVNPMLSPDGKLEAPGITVSWRAELLEPARRNATFVDGSGGPWELGLYRLAVTATDADAQRVEFTQWRTGMRRLEPVGGSP